MLTHEEFIVLKARHAVLWAELCELEETLEKTRNALFEVEVIQPEPEVLRDLIQNRAPGKLYYSNPWAVPMHSWVNIAPGIWKQRTA